VAALAIASVLFPYGHVNGEELRLLDDRAVAGGLVVMAIALVGIALVFARARSGWGVGLLGGLGTGIAVLHTRLAASVILDGVADRRWGLGFVLLGLAATGGVILALCALSGMNRGQKITLAPTLLVVPVLALVIAYGWQARDNLLGAAGGLGVLARALTAAALAGEMAVLLGGVASRSRLGAGLIGGVTLAQAAVWAFGVQRVPPLLEPVGFGDHTLVGALVGLGACAAVALAAVSFPAEAAARWRWDGLRRPTRSVV
jgi:hypothetical protein